MKWMKKGLIYKALGENNWKNNSALQPTPILLNNSIIRVFVGFRDKEGISRVGFLDLDADKPSRVIQVSEKPVLDIGEPGTFDENGVVPCAIVERGDKLFLYYAGYQLGQRVRFYAYTGLAVSYDGGNKFERYSKVPILDRTNDELYFRAIHSIFFDEGKWKAWYGAGSKYRKGKSKTLAVYNIRYMESKDGINFPRKGIVVIDLKDNEHRVGRPYVIKEDKLYKMFYGIGTEKVPYRLSYAESKDGINWNITEENIGINFSKSDWDSKMMAYPSIIKYKNEIYLFYNGNDYGRRGFGYAVLKK